MNGDGKPDLDASRIYYVGESLGSMYGTIFSALEPAVRASVLNVGGGSVEDIVRWSQSYHSLAAGLLAFAHAVAAQRGRRISTTITCFRISR